MFAHVLQQADRAGRTARQIVFGVGAWLSKSYNLALILLLLLILAAFQFVSVLQSVRDAVIAPYAEQQRIWIAQVETAKQYAATAEKLAEARQARINTLERDVAFLKGRIPNYDLTDSLRVRVDSLFWALSDSVKVAYQIIPEQRLVILRQDTTIRVQRIVMAKQDTALVQKDTVIRLYRSSKDSLLAVITTMPTAPGPVKIFGIIPAPSRRTSFLLGIASGAVVVAGIAR